MVGDQEVDLPHQGLGSQEYQRGADREVRLGDADAVVLRDTRLTVEMQIFFKHRNIFGLTARDLRYRTNSTPSPSAAGQTQHATQLRKT